MEHRKPNAVSRKLDPAKQAAFIKAYEDLLTAMALIGFRGGAGFVTQPGRR